MLTCGLVGFVTDPDLRRQWAEEHARAHGEVPDDVSVAPLAHQDAFPAKAVLEGEDRAAVFPEEPQGCTWTPT